MEVSQIQLAVLMVGIAAAIGARRGWGRELITCAIVLGTLLFLQLGGLSAVSGVFSGAFASMSGSASANCSVNGPSTVSTASTTADSSQPFSDLIFGGMTWLGYLVGHRHGAAPVTFSHRLLGMIPGAITGGAIAFYLNNVLFPDGIAFMQWLNTVNFVSSLPLLLGFGLVGAIGVFLFAARAGKGGH